MRAAAERNYFALKSRTQILRYWSNLQRDLVTIYGDEVRVFKRTFAQVAFKRRIQLAADRCDMRKPLFCSHPSPRQNTNGRDAGAREAKAPSDAPRSVS